MRNQMCFGRLPFRHHHQLSHPPQFFLFLLYFETVASRHTSQYLHHCQCWTVCPLVGNTYSTDVRRNSTHWNNTEKHSNLLASPSNLCMYVSAITTLSILLQQWANTDHKSRQNQDSQLRTAVASDGSATSKNLWPNATCSTRETDHHSVLTEAVTRQGHLTQLFFV